METPFIEGMVQGFLIVDSILFIICAAKYLCGR